MRVKSSILAVSMLVTGWLCYLAFSAGYMMGKNNSVLGNQAEQAKLECESTLPRNQHCEIIIKAIPVEEG